MNIRLDDKLGLVISSQMKAEEAQTTQWLSEFISYGKQSGGRRREEEGERKVGEKETQEVVRGTWWIL